MNSGYETERLDGDGDVGDGCGCSQGLMYSSSSRPGEVHSGVGGGVFGNMHHVRREQRPDRDRDPEEEEDLGEGWTRAGRRATQARARATTATGTRGGKAPPPPAPSGGAAATLLVVVEEGASVRRLLEKLHETLVACIIILLGFLLFTNTPQQRSCRVVGVLWARVDMERNTKHWTVVALALDGCRRSTTTGTLHNRPKPNQHNRTCVQRG